MEEQRSEATERSNKCLKGTDQVSARILKSASSVHAALAAQASGPGDHLHSPRRFMSPSTMRTQI
eukprot:scaffold2775_cov91-Skeletonema_marinoi.AAC.2